MPYHSVSDLPKSVTGVLPDHAQEIYLKAYNNAWAEYREPSKRIGGASQEETASRVAWGAVKKMYEKDEKTGKWHRIREKA